MTAFLVEKSATIADVIELTGIRPNNFWFEYFLQLFKNACFRFDDLSALVNFLGTDKSEIIRKLKVLDVDGDYFELRSMYVMKHDFTDVDFNRLRSRKIKVIEIDSNSEVKIDK